MTTWLTKALILKMGARPLQRVIDKDIKRPLSRELLFGNLKNGGNVTVDVKDGELVLNTTSIPEEATVAESSDN